MTTKTIWNKAADLLPKEGMVVETISARGIQRDLTRLGGLWFTPDGFIHVYSEIVFWREKRSDLARRAVASRRPVNHLMPRKACPPMICKFIAQDGTFFVRTMREEETETVADLINASPHATVTADQLRRITRLQHYQCWVIDAGGEIRGCMAVMLAPGSRQIDLLLIDAAHRCRGYGSAMLDLIKRMAVDSCLSVWATIPKEYEHAMAFFTQRGFSSKGGIQPNGDVKFAFCAELHDHPSHWLWRVRPVSPAFEATSRQRSRWSAETRGA